VSQPRAGALDTGEFDLGPAQAAPREPRIVPLVATLILVSLLGALEVTIVGSSLATLTEDLGGAAAIAWVMTAYVLAATVSTPVLGQLGDIHGRRPVFLAALVLFVLGTALCGVAPSLGVLIGARLLQGVGSAGTSLLSQTILADVLPPRRRPLVMSLLASVFAVAAVVGPLVGGVLTDTVGWRWGFLGIVPLGAVALVASLRVIPRGLRSPGTGFDTAGAVLLGIVLTAFILLLTAGPTAGWTSPPVAALAVVSLVAGAVLVRQEGRVAHPVLPLRLLRDRIVVGALVLAVVHGGGLLAVIGYLPAYTQLHYGTSATVAGAVPLALVVGLLISSNGAGALISRSGVYKIYPVAGSALAAVVLAVLAATLPSLSLVGLCAGLLLLGLGAGSFMHLPVVIVQNEAASDEVGVATSAVTLVRQAASAVGVAAIGAVIAAALLAAGGEPELGQAYTGAMVPVLAALAVVFGIGCAVSAATPAVVLRRGHAPEAADA